MLLLLAFFLVGLVECSKFGQLLRCPRVASVELTGDRSATVRFKDYFTRLILTNRQLFVDGNATAALRIIQEDRIIRPEEKISLRVGDRVVLGVSNENADVSELEKVVRQLAEYILNSHDKEELTIDQGMDMMVFPIIEE